MGRTQIYLGEGELEILERVSRATGASRSELIRRAIRRTFGQSSKAERLEILKETAGSWRGGSFSGAEYVDVIRGDLGERLRRHGLD